MIRRTLTVLAAGALAATAFVGTAAAADPPPAATGTISCRLVGRMVFAPALATGGTTATAGVFVGKANGCVGSDGAAVVKSGLVTAAVNLPANDCAALASPGAISLDGNVHWKTTMGSGPIADTTISLGSLTADPLSILKPKYAATGSASAGSFSGQALSSTLSVSQAYAAIHKQCDAGRFRGFTVRASQSTLVIGTLPV